MSGHIGDFIGAAVQIIILTLAIHQILRIFRGTRSAQIVAGIALIAASAVLAIFLFHLDVVAFLLKWIIIYLAVVAAVIFQPELRHALARLGSALRKTVRETDEARISRIEMIANAAGRLAQQRHGALIAIERKDKLRGYEEQGTRLGVPIVTELLQSIFYPKSPLHDGGVTIVNNTISAARCIFPLSTNTDIGSLGTRHRAAIGISEETDAVVVVVSEETGSIRLVCEGRLTKPLTPAQLVRYLKAVLPMESTDTLRHLRDVFAPVGNGSEGGAAQAEAAAESGHQSQPTEERQ